MEFHVSRASRERFVFEDALFSITGNAIIADIRAARLFAQRLSAGWGRIIPAGEINAMGLIDEISHLMIAEYRRQTRAGIFGEALAFVRERVGEAEVDIALNAFCADFPTVDVFRGRNTVAAYLAGSTDGVSNREIALEELLMLWLSNANAAFARYGELFDDAALAQNTAYRGIIEQLQNFFDTQPAFFDGQSLIAALRAPALAHPDSLDAQLRYIEARWMSAVPALRTMLVRVLSGHDLIQEEQRSLAQYFGTGAGVAGGVTAGGFGGFGKPEYSDDDIRSAVRANYATDPEYEAYTQDKAWMPRLVLLAKNAYVWLDQLSKKYQRDISRLDQVPDEELDMLQRWGITGLWLIGLWERSVASKRIKQMMGASDAVASAYSLMDYAIAQDLGGADAMRALKEKAWKRGIRMGSDMVPNHFGIDSTWVVNRPDFFLSLDHPPYPGYTFNGPDLSEDSRVGIFLEDHYYNRSDAAVVFKRLDRWTGEARYIYHGNDGTSMPWNDTAQLNYLRADVREAIIQTILDVARNFPIIRFDAAMTLAKRHVQRLWFPIPGSGDGIPSRAGMGMSKEDFDRMVPQEFWREVVDRAAVEAPDTLLLAEAFWMLEGYFVRTLGMHRVYNSAFMHMLRDEDNAKYRYLIKETLEFDPQILKRYVNFMNNPDEKTAVEQFGKGDKYFGVALLMSTLPGLPMYGHGQMEGYAEKYGMEYRRPKLDETPDQGLIDYHARMVFPILHKRYLFAEVERFFLYDFYTTSGAVDENVFAYSNQFGDERTLVLFHNKSVSTRGYVRTSAAYLSPNEGLRQTALGDVFGLHRDDTHFLRFRDHVTGLEFLRSSRDIHERGLYAELGAYQCHIFLDVREVNDTDGSYARLNADLNGRGVPSIDEALLDFTNQSILPPMRAYITAETLRQLAGSMITADQVKRGKVPAVDATLVERVATQAQPLIAAIVERTGSSLTAEAAQNIATGLARDVAAVLRLPALLSTALKPAARKATLAPVAAAASKPKRAVKPKASAGVLSEFATRIVADMPASAALLAWALIQRLGDIAPAASSATPDATEQDATPVLGWLDTLALRKPLLEAFRGLGMDDGAAQHALETVRMLLSRSVAPADTLKTSEGKAITAKVVKKLDPIQAEALMLLGTPERAQFAGVNRWEGVDYFNKERFERLVILRAVAETALTYDESGVVKKRASISAIKAKEKSASALLAWAAECGYRI
jgi:glycosidase